MPEFSQHPLCVWGIQIAVLFPKHKKRQEHTPTQLGNRSSFVSEYNWSIMHLHYSLNKFRSKVFWINVELVVVQSLQWTQKPSKLHTLMRCYKINKFAQIYDRSLLKAQLLLWWIEGPLSPKCLIADNADNIYTSWGTATKTVSSQIQITKQMSRQSVHNVSEINLY